MNHIRFMTNLIIDNNEFPVPAGMTILDAAGRAGISIPTLCHGDGVEHYASCMVCVVRDVAAGKLVPACSTLVADNMRIETSTPEVREARKQALELLLGEHLGDCDAPCQVICRANINIPRMIRQVRDGKLADAADTVRAHAPLPDSVAGECPAPCERGCRRGRIDQGIAIRLLVKYVVDANPGCVNPCEPGAVRDAGGGGAAAAGKAAGKDRRFNSRFGPLREEDKAIFMLEAAAGHRVAPANGTAFTRDEAIREAGRCLHCDCRKADTCRLRQYADEYKADASRFRAAEREPFVKNMQHEDVVFEPGKCIKCGLCVRISAGYDDAPGLAFFGRGADTRIMAPLGMELAVVLGKAAAECVAACPTGALSWK